MKPLYSPKSNNMLRKQWAFHPRKRNTREMHPYRVLKNKVLKSIESEGISEAAKTFENTFSEVNLRLAEVKLKEQSEEAIFLSEARRNMLGKNEVQGSPRRIFWVK